jgi:hypothetical protein
MENAMESLGSSIAGMEIGYPQKEVKQWAPLHHPQTEANRTFQAMHLTAHSKTKSLSTSGSKPKDE